MRSACASRSTSAINARSGSATPAPGLGKLDLGHAPPILPDPAGRAAVAAYPPGATAPTTDASDALVIDVPPRSIAVVTVAD